LGALVAAIGLAAGALVLSGPASAQPDGDAASGQVPAAAVRALDGEQYLEGEPIWLCLDPSNEPAFFLAWLHHSFVLVGTDEMGRTRRRREDRPTRDLQVVDAAGRVLKPRGGEFAETFCFDDSTGRAPLVGNGPGVPAGEWEIRRGGAGADSARVLARFRVLAPRGSERSVRDALARAARLAARGDAPDDKDVKQAAALYDAILRRYPRTTYLSVIYAGMWRVRQHTRFADDPDRWLEEIFARFHDTCFGTIALDQWVRDMGPERAKKTVAHLVGLYPDTPLSRAARRYL
jgi:hypothetical protein